MTEQQYFKNLQKPKRKVDVVLDTDTYNEIDDQFALSYMLKSTDKFNVKGICATPFLNARSNSPKDGMEKSYEEILRLLHLLDMDEFAKNVYHGSEHYLKSEAEATDSPAADFLANLAEEYSPENPLYIVAIGAITNVASAIIKNPNIKENCVIVWLGGHALHCNTPASEFNMVQDIAAARVVFGCGVPFVQVPCNGVVTHFTTSEPELRHHLGGKNELCDYLIESTVSEAETYAKGLPWTRIIWDVCAVAWLSDWNDEFVSDKLIPAPVPEYDRYYATPQDRHLIKYVDWVDRDRLFNDLFKVLSR